jgi:tetratricopeptide (TPR) repeat protein
MPAHHKICLALTPANLKLAEADIKQYSIDHEPISWVVGHLLLSHQCVRDVSGFSHPTRTADKGIEHIEEALKVTTEKDHRSGFVAAQWGLARLYPKRVAGNRTENLTKALACAETALRVCNNTPTPVAFVAKLYELIGSIYADHEFAPSNSRAANQDLAIRNYLASLERSSMYADNGEWANRQMNVGLIYYNRKNGKRRSNSKVAVKHLVEALKVFTKSKHRNAWAMTHQHLGLSYWQLVQIPVRMPAKLSKEKFVERFEQLSTLVEKCIASCTNTMQVFTPTCHPEGW